MPVTTAGFAADDVVWTEQVPRVEHVHIPSTADGTAQPAWWLPPQGAGPRPLVVVLHSWSFGHEQHFGVPIARWADHVGWALLQPDFRGPFNRPEATGSDLAVQDVIDAVDFARAAADIDPDHVYGIGFSGGGLMALLLAGRHPDRFTGVVSWVPMYDLVDWYVYNLHYGRPQYAEDIIASCGGDPTADAEAYSSCRHRSPRTHIGGARAAGIPVYVGGGLTDEVVTPDTVLAVFNDLAEAGDRIGAGVLAQAARHELPPAIHGAVAPGHWFGRHDPPVVFSRTSGPATVVVFDGAHEMIFAPGLRWIWQLHESAATAAPAGGAGSGP